MNTTVTTWSRATTGSRLAIAVGQLCSPEDRSEERGPEPAENAETPRLPDPEQARYRRVQKVTTNRRVGR